MAQRWNGFFILVFVSLGQVAMDVYLPSMPSMVHDLHADSHSVQMTMNIFLFGYAGSQLFYGALADCYGRRPVILGGLSIFCIASLMIVLMNSIQEIILFRLLQGIGVGAASTLSRTILRDVFAGQRLATMSAYMGIAWSIVPLIAPVMGGYIQHYLGWRYNFLLISLIGIIMLLLTLLRLEESLPKSSQRSLQWMVLIQDYRHILSSANFIFHMFLLIIMYSTMVAFNLIAPFLFQVQLKFTPAHYGWIILLIAAGNILGSTVNARLVQVMSLSMAIWCGLACYLFWAIILFAFALGHHLSMWTLMIPNFLIFFASGIVYPCATAASLLPFSDRAGSAGALYGFIVIVSGSIVGVIMSSLSTNTLLPLASCLLVLALSGVASFFWYYKYNNCQISAYS